MVLFVASVKLTSQYRDVMNGRGYVVATFARTGFANLGSTGIQLGGIGAMAPTRRGTFRASVAVPYSQGSSPRSSMAASRRRSYET